MSYDLTIRSDAAFSNRVQAKIAMAFLGKCAGVVANGTSSFVLDDRPSRWMEIDLDCVTEEGDSVEEPLDEASEINCIRLHIPYPYLKAATLNQGYLPLALSIANHLKWELYDEQSGGAYT